jgi:hypothetical protein
VYVHSHGQASLDAVQIAQTPYDAVEAASNASLKMERWCGALASLTRPARCLTRWRHTRVSLVKGGRKCGVRVHSQSSVCISTTRIDDVKGDSCLEFKGKGTTAIVHSVELMRVHGIGTLLRASTPFSLIGPLSPR